MEKHSYERKDSVENYDLLRDLPENIKLAYAKQILSISHGKSILDLGFGTGNILIPLSKLNKDSTIYGVDNSKEMCLKTKGKLKGDTKIFQGELRQFIENFGKVDVLHFKAILHCVKNPEELINEIMASVNAGGYIITSHEVSQTEDRIEQIFEYDSIDDSEVELVFEYYFRLRTDMSIPFKSRRFPAGNSDKVSDYLIQSGKFILENGISGDNLNWKRSIKILDILNAMKMGTFGVFFDGVSERKRNDLYKKLINFCKDKKIDLKKTRLLPSRFKINVLKKKNKS